MRSLLPLNKFQISKYCTNADEKHQVQARTITEKFTDSMRKIAELRKTAKDQRADYEQKSKETWSKSLKPFDGYVPRFQYNGFVKRSHWHFYDENRLIKEQSPETELQFNYRMRRKHKYCILMAFAGGNYYGMQYNKDMNTIEDELLNAMVKNQWILEEHLEKPWFFNFQRGSRTDRGVSAARMNVSAVLRMYFAF